MSNKTAMMKLYDMLDEGQISEIAEIKEFFLMLERKQIANAYNDGCEERHNEPVNGDEYYNETYKGGEQ